MKRRIPGSLIFFGIVALVIWLKPDRPAPSATSAPGFSSTPGEAASPAQDFRVERDEQETFRCDGRSHCSEMHSCDEARFFLRNCPGVKMDGDGDGMPCEDRCGH